MAAACGIGVKTAEVAARALVERYRPEVLISAGLAGALADDLRLGAIIVPSEVIDASNGARYRCDTGTQSAGGAVLVTVADVASEAAKSAVAAKFHGSLVDMEAAGVAQVAREKGITFRCVKAISDERGFSLPPLGRFVRNGEFRTGAFLAWVVFRPQHWGPTLALARSTARSSHALCNWLRQNLAAQFQGAELLH